MPLLLLFGVIAHVGHQGSEYLTDSLPKWFLPWSFGSAVVQLVMAVLLLIGALRLLRHRSSGRMMIAISCVVLIALGVAWIVISVLQTYDWSYSPETTNTDFNTDFYYTSSASGVVATVVRLMFPVVTMILALVPSSRRWCEPVKTPGYVGH